MSILEGFTGSRISLIALSRVRLPRARVSPMRDVIPIFDRLVPVCSGVGSFDLAAVMRITSKRNDCT